eukprot:7262893-Pyramimonas_sp.AAC.1
MRSVLEGLSEEAGVGIESLSIGSGCSGSDIWYHVLDMVTRFWAKDPVGKLSPDSSSLIYQASPLPHRS